MPGVHPSYSASSLSLTASTQTSSVPPAAPPATSTHSNNISDHSLAPLSTTASKSRFFPLSISPVGRSSPLSRMGQGPSQPATPLPQSATSTTFLAGSKLKRAFGGRRRKSEDASAVFRTITQGEVMKEDERVIEDVACPPTPKASQQIQIETPTPLNTSDNTKQVEDSSSSKLLHPEAPSKVSLEERDSKDLPNVPPVDNVQVTIAKQTEDANPPVQSLPIPTPVSVPVSGVSAEPIPRRRRSPDDQEVGRHKTEYDIKQDWRKSDSTMISHGTIRPGYGNRSPRPVSLAESSHSGHTIVPVNRRLSALITDAEFAMAEEGETGDEITTRLPSRASPASSVKARHRRSMSLSVGITLGQRSKPCADVSLTPTQDARQPRNFTDNQLLSAQDIPTLSTASAKGIIGSSTSPGTTQSAGSNIRSRLAAWTSGRSQQTNPSYPSSRQNPANGPTGLAPAAGIAMGFGKRAAEKVHRVLGGLSSSASSHSGYSSSSSTGTGQSSSSDPMSRSTSELSIANTTSTSHSIWKGKRRTPNAPSGAWSVASSVTSASVSDYDSFSTPSGPRLGKRLRPPKRSPNGVPIVGGLVFGRDLRTCVQDTAIRPVEPSQSGVSKDVVERLLPALVVRCAQHLTQWGIQEEGLFRVNGRPSHVAKLRSEFDTGADYNLIEADPSELDPHSVASIFKAYLRELPQPLLTASLSSHFESILTAENATESSSKVTSQPIKRETRGPGLPTGGPRSGFSQGLRKPPSLSTLAMPSFAGMRALSESSVAAVAYLISLLPTENRDLLYTVVELIRATAAKCKETKMPLGNLLLVFCPSLNMSPALLRVLCENDNIWNGPAYPPPAANTASSDDKPATAALDVPTQQHRDSDITVSSSNDDNASYVSALSELIGSATSASPASTSPNVPPLSSSTDSIATPSTLSDDSSFTQATPSAPSEASHMAKPDPSYGGQPSVADTEELSLPQPSRRPAISSPVPFPSTGGSHSSPATPNAARKSFTLLSFPPLRSETNSTVINATTSSSTWRRPNRPSLHLLFGKKSSSSLSAAAAIAPSATSIIISSPIPINASSSTDSLPSSASAHHHSSLAPPKLDTPISSSPINLRFEDASMEISSSHDNPEVRLRPPSDSIGSDGRIDSMGSSLYSTPQETPTTPLSKSSSQAVLHAFVNDDVPLPNPYDPVDASLPNPFPRSPSQLSMTPSITIGIEDSLEDNWVQSVLDAATAGPISS
ncbi:hypothetical protein ABKN59_007867 [Abortiporus biennis]